MSTQRYTLSVFGALIAGLVGGGAAILLVSGSFLYASPLQESIRTQRIVIVDASGRERMGLGMVDGVPRLMLLDHDGRTRLELGLLDDGAPRLSFLDPHEKMRLELGAPADGSPALVVLDAREQTVWQAP